METVYQAGIFISGFVCGLCSYEFGKLLGLYLRERNANKRPKLRIAEGGFVLGRMK